MNSEITWQPGGARVGSNTEGTVISIIGLKEHHEVKIILKKPICFSKDKMFGKETQMEANLINVM